MSTSDFPLPDNNSQLTAQKYNLSYHVNSTFIEAIYQHLLMLKTLGKPEYKNISQIKLVKTKNIATALMNIIETKIEEFKTWYEKQYNHHEESVRFFSDLILSLPK